MMSQLMTIKALSIGNFGVAGALPSGLVTALLAALVWFTLNRDKPYAGFPVISSDKSEFQQQGIQILRKGAELTKNGWFQVPSQFAHEIRNDPRLDFRAITRDEMMADYHGFDSVREGTRPDGFLPKIIRSKLTLVLPSLTEDIVDETDFVVPHCLGEDPEWKTHSMKNALLDIVARVSTRVFAGVDLARNEEYVQIAKMNTVQSFVGAQELSQRPGFLRPIMQWFNPTLRDLRAQIRKARALVGPVVQKRLEERAAATSLDDTPARNSIVWMADAAEGKATPDFVAGQLALSLASIHTTTEVLTRCILQLCDTPKVADDLRHEMLEVLAKEGWAKTSLYKMKLLDSFVKEVQRHNPTNAASMLRHVKDTVTLSDNTRIPKGSQIMVIDTGTQDSAIHEHPEKFDAYRYVKLRSRPGEESKHQIVTTEPTNLTFGYGQYACPGRFFAAHEMKILLCFLVLRYDFRRPDKGDEQAPDYVAFEQMSYTNPFIRIQSRRRREEVDLRSPGADFL
ncbi:hypothetical protein PRZ48_007982 [Zasmidium cellare]|uniref:Cytochrome P450 n=1 Tax=Zasmidium cellare TaxID=395010 RepID=A0ABR0EEV5_ZASCE|nr:hypothetical protein PRZ48_007982 [Zasmidium cellare]